MSPRSTLWLVVCVTCSSIASWLAPGLAEGLGNGLFQGEAAPIGLIATAPTLPSAPQEPVKLPPPDDPLELGDRGPQVQEVQILLQQLGYGLKPDGAFGRQTQQAILHFQQAVGLAPTGQVDVATWQNLQAAQPDISSLLPVDSPPPVEEPDESPAPEENAPPAGEDGSFPLGWKLVGGVAIATLCMGVGYQWRQSRSIKKPRRRQEVYRSEVDESQTSLIDAIPTEAIPVPNEPQGSAPPHPGNPPSDSVEVSITSNYANGTGPEGPKSDRASASDMARLPKIDITEELIHDLRHPDPTKRRRAIWELGQRGDSKAMQPLLDLMVHSDSNQQSLILAAISEIGIRALKPLNRALLHSLQDDSAEVRKNAIRDVTRIYDQMAQLSQLLRHAMDDSDAEVRDTAQWALGQLNRVRTLSDSDESSPVPQLNDPSHPSMQADESS